MKVIKWLFAAFDRQSLLCPKAITFLNSQRGYLRPDTTTVSCDLRPQHFWSHKEDICGLWPPQFVVAKGQNIFEVTERIFAAGVRHSSLWPKALTFLKSQRGYLRPEAAIFRCALRPQLTVGLKPARGRLQYSCSGSSASCQLITWFKP